MQGYAIGESGEGVAFADWGYLLVFEIVTQMLRPYRTNQSKFFSFFLSTFYLPKVVCRFQKHCGYW
jgi:hypothetical protein